MARDRTREGGEDGSREHRGARSPARANMPGSLEHASGDVEEFDAALVRGAGGTPVDAEVEPEGALARRVERAVSPARRPSQGNRAASFLRASWAELQRVQWPDRRQVGQATAVVIGFVAVAGVYLGLADWVAQKIVNAIL